MTGPNRWERSCFVRGWAAFCVGVILATANVAFAESRAERYDIHIVEARLGAALTALALQTDKQLFFPYDLADAQGVHPVSGNYTVDEALDLMLRDTGFSGGLTDSGVITISRVASTDSEGKTMGARDQKSSPNKRKGLLGILAAAFSVGAGAQETADSVEGDFGGELEEIVVTGTNIRGVENPTTPVIQFDRRDIELSGATTVEDFLRIIPQNFSSASLLAGNSDSSFSGPDGSEVQATGVDLRGLGAGSTLVLLNGRRMSAAGSSSFVDVSVLPLGLIERVDVLTDGASAVYGSDAVGGVVNFITRKDYEGFEISGRYGTVTDGSKEDFSVGGAGGFNWNSGSFFTSIEYVETSPLLVEERDFVDVSEANPTASLGADTTRLSMAGSVNQQLLERLNFGVDFLFTDREASREQVFSATRLNSSERQAWFLNSRLEYEIDNDRVASLFVDYGEDNADTIFLSGTAADPGLFNNGLLTIEGQVSGQLFDVRAGSINFSTGAQYREESFKKEGDSTIGTSREVSAVYGELLVPLWSADGDALVEKVDLSLAGRYEDYSDFGDTFNPKIGARVKFRSGFALRGTYAEAFRAPDLQTRNIPEGRVISIFSAANIDAFEAPTPNNPLLPGFITQLELIGGNPGILSESAETWTVGFDFAPTFFDGFNLSASFYNIEYEDRIELITFEDVFEDPNLIQFVDLSPDVAFVQSQMDLGVFDIPQLFLTGVPTPAEDIDLLVESRVQNIARRSVRGLDVAFQYSRETSLGELGLDLNSAYLFEYDRQLAPGAAVSDDLNTLYSPVDFRLRVSAGLTRGAITGRVSANYVDGYSDNINPELANDIDRWTTIDLSLSYDGLPDSGARALEGFDIAVIVQNLFDEEPPFVETSEGLNFDPTNANPFGRIVTISFSKTF